MEAAWGGEECNSVDKEEKKFCALGKYIVNTNIWPRSASNIVPVVAVTTTHHRLLDDKPTLP